MPPKSCYLNIFQMSLFFLVITNSTKWDLKANKICLIIERISNAYQASGISELTIIEYSKIFVHFKFSYKNRVQEYASLMFCFKLKLFLVIHSGSSIINKERDEKKSFSSSLLLKKNKRDQKKCFKMMNMLLYTECLKLATAILLYV